LSIARLSIARLSIVRLIIHWSSRTPLISICVSAVIPWSRSIIIIICSMSDCRSSYWWSTWVRMNIVRTRSENGTDSMINNGISCPSGDTTCHCAANVSTKSRSSTAARGTVIMYYVDSFSRYKRLSWW
jgi:hypothetical protein